MKNRVSVLILMLFLPFLGFAQGADKVLSKKEIRKSRPSYIRLSFGFNASSFRDFATSPLVYSGTATYSEFSKLRLDQERETDFGLSFSTGNFSNSFNDHVSASAVKMLTGHYSQLFKFKKLSKGKYNVKVGGALNITGNLRTNPSLQNNALGLEIIPTLFGSIKVTKDISLKKEKNKRFLFIRYKVKPKVRHLSFNLNVGLMNSSYRNGFVYSGQSAVLNDTRAFDDYSFNMFSGFRINSALDYTITLANKNKIQFSYLWQAYNTGESLDEIEVANHIFKLSFLFNTNAK